MATGLVIFGLSDAIGLIFEREPPATGKQGYAIAVQADTDTGGPAVDVIPDWGTVLPKADVAKGQQITSKCASCHLFTADGANSTGPGLYGVGRPPARLAPRLQLRLGDAGLRQEEPGPGPTTCSTSSSRAPGSSCRAPR